MAIGTESDGSVMFPCTRAGLYGFKPGRGKTDYTVVQPGGEPYDTIGVMAKGCEDIASVMNVLMNEQLQVRSSGDSWEGVKVGLVDLRQWWLPELYLESEPKSYQEQVLTAVEEGMRTIEEKGARVIRSTPLITMPEFEKDIPGTQGLHDVMTQPFQKRLRNSCPSSPTARRRLSEK